MGARWHCELCGNGDEPDLGRVCDCVTMLRVDWMVLRMLWCAVRELAMQGSIDGVLARDNSGTLVLDRPHAELLDSLFFRGEECPDTVYPLASAAGEDRCE